MTWILQLLCEGSGGSVVRTLREFSDLETWENNNWRSALVLLQSRPGKTTTGARHWCCYRVDPGKWWGLRDTGSKWIHFTTVFCARLPALETGSY
ncbi:hypothetical protein PoB_002102600 [Plakobranchus ocellatus]|uniref:Uncharacterized protein n=1 Tax=Plakobranchus ocellatus TaxID=259542 RepID=A0AAV3Z5E2_9GAST|nr:hypothetical protein PoB_002102600 [Plakobranchus ocellatus]